MENLEYKNIKEIKEIVNNIEVNYFKYSQDEIYEFVNLLSKDNRKTVKKLALKILNYNDKIQKEIKRVKNMYNFDLIYLDKYKDKKLNQHSYLAGVDEVGRGPLAGPIVACSVILNLDKIYDVQNLILYINDSKKLSHKKRKELCTIIKEKCVDYKIAFCSNEEIDEKGISWCNNEIFKKTVYGLKVEPTIILSDGYRIKNINLLNEAVVKGDTKSASIACASILAKEYRDDLMIKWHEKYPEYNFKKNVGYGTQEHIESIKKYGISPIHRMSFLKNI